MSKARLSKASPQENDLPACRICDGPSTGVHYGVISCEACKAFFKRNAPKGDQYECAERRCCEISYKNRASCPYCRIQKCLMAGMSREAIKAGRRSREAHKIIQNEKRKEIKQNSGIIEENRLPRGLDTGPITFTNSLTISRKIPVKNNSSYAAKYFESREKKSSFSDTQLDSSGENQHDSTSDASSYGSFSAQNSDPAAEESQMSTGSISELIKLFQNATLIDDDFDNTLLLDCISSTNNSATRNVDKTGEISEIYTTINSPDLVDLLLNNAFQFGCNQHLYNHSRIEIYEKVIQRMYIKHKPCTGGSSNIGETLSEEAHQIIEMVDLKAKIFGTLKPLPISEYVKFYMETGLDLDGRKDLIVDMINFFEVNIREGVGFLRSIPGFSNLSLQDQIDLFKTNHNEYFMLSTHKCFNLEHKVFSFNGKVNHVNDLAKIKGDHAEDMLYMERMISNLELDLEETAVLAAFSLMSADGCHLSDREMVEKIQDFLLECLFFVFDKHHPDDKTRFLRVLRCLIGLRNFRKSDMEVEEHCNHLSLGIVDVPPLIQEFMTNPWSCSNSC